MVSKMDESSTIKGKKKILAAAPERRLGGSTHPKKKKIGSPKREKWSAEHDWEREWDRLGKKRELDRTIKRLREASIPSYNLQSRDLHGLHRPPVHSQCINPLISTSKEVQLHSKENEKRLAEHHSRTWRRCSRTIQRSRWRSGETRKKKGEKKYEFSGTTLSLVSLIGDANDALIDWSCGYWHSSSEMVAKAPSDPWMWESVTRNNSSMEGAIGAR